MQYLNSGNNYKKQAADKSLAALLTKSMLISSAKQMLDHLFGLPADSISSEIDKNTQETLPQSSSITLAQKLDAVEVEKSKILLDSKSRVLKNLKMELYIFEATFNKITEHLLYC